MATRHCLLAIALLTVFSASSAQAQERWLPYVEWEGRASSIRAVGQGNLFVPLWQDSESILFADLRGMWTDNEAAEGNWGLAYRRMTAGDWIVGGYVFYDLRHSEFSNTFHQGSIGAELLNVNWGFRVNGYIPDQGVVATNSLNRAFLQGNNIVVRPGLEAAYWGMDVEAERLLWWHRAGGDCSFGRLGGCFNDVEAEVWASAGLFHFDNNADGFESMTGPRIRTELRLYDLPMISYDSRLVISGQYEHDDVRGSVGTGMLTVRIPIGPGDAKPLSPLDRRMVAPIVRDVDIITNTGLGPAEQAKLVLTGQTLNNVTLIDGTTANPEAVFAGAGPGSVVIFNGGAGIIDTDAGFVFNDGQLAIGGGPAGAFVFGCDTGALAVFGSRPRVLGTNPANNVFTLLDNNIIAGLNITGGLNGIFEPDSGTHRILNNRVTGAALNGAAFTANLNGEISGNRFTGNAFNGLIVGGTLNGDFLGNRFNNNGLNGVFAGTINGTTSGNAFNGNTSSGLFVTTSIFDDVSGNQFVGNGDSGFTLNGAMTGDVTGNVAANNGTDDKAADHGIALLGGVTGNVTGNVANDNFGDGIHIVGDVTGNISGNITNNNDPGIFVMGNVGGNVSGNTSNDNAGAGLLIDGNIAGTLDNNTTLRNGLINMVENTEGDSEGIFVNGDVGTGLAMGVDAIFNNTSTGNFDENIEINGAVHGNFADNLANDSVASEGVDIAGLVDGDVVGNTANGNGSAGGDEGLAFDGGVAGDVSNNVTNENADQGMEFAFVGGNVSNNTVIGNADDGILVNADIGGTLDNNVVLQNGLIDMASDGGILVTGDAGTTLAANADAIFDNQSLGNFDNGIEVQGSIFGNVRDNTTDGNGGNGFQWTDVLAGTVFDSNTSNGNGADGFNFGDNNGTFTNNTASFNGGMGFNGGANNGTAFGNFGIGNTGGGNTFP